MAAASWSQAVELLAGVSARERNTPIERENTEARTCVVWVVGGKINGATNGLHRKWILLAAQHR